MSGPGQVDADGATDLVHGPRRVPLAVDATVAARVRRRVPTR
ncbi:hypothetical protein [Streptomyces sp. YKOK-I1]